MPVPCTLRINTDEELEVLQAALQMYFDYSNDMCLDDAVTTTQEIRHLASQSDEFVNGAMVDRRKSVNGAIDRLLALNSLLERAEGLR